MNKKIKGVIINEYPDNKKITTHKKISLLDPPFIYIPLEEKSRKYFALVSVGQKVLIGEKVAESQEIKGLPLFSSISGVVKSITSNQWIGDGKLVNCIEIENDYQEKLYEYPITRSIEELTREEMRNIIEKCGIVGQGGGGFPTYIKYLANNIETIIVNAIECEPFLTNDYHIIMEKTEEFLIGISWAMKMAGAKKAIIAIKKNNQEAIIKLKEYLKDDNINICQFASRYPAGWEKIVVQQIIKKTYEKLPSEVGVIVNNVGTILAIYNALKKNIPLVEKRVTFSGYGLKNPANVCLKIGTKASYVLEKLGGYFDKRITLIVGGVMTGRSLASEEVIISRIINGIIIQEDRNSITKEETCMGCGNCVLFCPTKIAPIEIRNAFLSKNIKLDLYKPELCISCGICSYICPSRIELTASVNQAKEKIMREKS